MKKNIFLVIMVYALNIFAQGSEVKEWGKYFIEENLDGCFLLYDNSKGEYLYYNNERCNTSFSPASTFKIPNSLFALESKAVKDEKEVLKWNGKQYSFKDWNSDLDMERAIKVSCVWFYQEIAERIGETKMQEFIDVTSYGNKEIKGEINRFWLSGKLEINAYQQIEFLRKFYFYQFPFEIKNVDIVKKIIILDNNEKYKLSGKTGWNDIKEKPVGWLVGYVEKGTDVYFFALNFNMEKLEEAPLRMKIVKEVLTSHGIIE